MDQTSLTGIIKNWISSHRLPIAVVLIILISGIAVVTEKALEITENPNFCGKNCHIMRPYYNSWLASPHNKVRCVECHYEPGLIGHVKGKMGGLMQLYRYETTTEEYSGKLYAKVMDDNCLICHEKIIFPSEISYIGANFSHRNHLFQPKRGIGLTCTSCHSMRLSDRKEHLAVTDPSCTRCHPNFMQRDAGHIVVATSTCFTCHFRDVPGNTSISGCPSCHRPPGETHRNYTNFNHASHVSRGFECLTCHINTSTGANDVVQESKCFSCHNIKERVKRYDDSGFVHKNHVTNNKIACLECHSNVKHTPAIKENLCATCHDQEHPADWLTTHKEQVLIGKVCSNCHQPRFCSDCHATGVARGKKGK